jgi:cytochrome P450
MDHEDANVTSIYYDPYDYEIDADPHPVWTRMRDELPVYWNERYQFFALSRFEDVWSAYLDTKTFSSTHGVTLDMLMADAPVEHPSMIFMDPPEHDAMRKLVSRAFTPRRIADLEESVRQLVVDYLDPFVGAGEFDYVSEFGALLPPMVIGALIGVPVDDRDQVRRWFDEMMHLGEGDTGMGDAALAAMGEIMDYAGGMISERRESPNDDFVSALLSAEVDIEGTPRRLTDLEIQNFIMMLAGAGVETVARLLSWAAVLFARNPAERAKVVADPNLIPNAIEELLRYEAPSPVNGRFTLHDVEVLGIRIPAESRVLLLNGSANRDPREFDDPDAFRVDRTIKRHISFGYSAHFCLGAALARLESRIALEETFARFPTWEIDESKLEMVRTVSVRGYSSVPISVG